ncbi:MAG: transposase, partial [Bdellovibrionales bacterium]|nr:transposase [Bdellovibrionales bacterium]
GLAKVRKISPKISFNWNKTRCDIETLKAVVQHRLDVMAHFHRAFRKVYHTELEKLSKMGSGDVHLFREASNWLFNRLPTAELSETEQNKLSQVLKKNSMLSMMYQLEKGLLALWDGASGSPEQLADQLEQWCRKAEASGVAAMERFSKRLRSYALASS